jgi:hypothetical protein
MVSMRIFDTPVKAKVTVLADLLVVWGSVTWWGLHRHPERRFWPGLLIGFQSVAILLLVEWGHAIAHIFSARYAGAPMDELRITAGMPRTLYWNNEVSPDTHRMRALGGPIYNGLGLLLSSAIYGLVPGKSIARELAGWSVLGHGALLIASLSPVAIVDGGTILKWTLVARGKSTTEADQVVQLVDRVMGIVGGTIGAGFIARRKWVPGLVLVGIGVVVTGIAAGKIR